MPRRPLQCLLGTACAALILTATPAAAQTIAGRLVDSESRKPLRGAMVVVLDHAARELTSTVADTSGVFYADLPAAGAYRLRVVSDSTYAFETDALIVGAAEFVERLFVVSRVEKIFFEFQVDRSVSVVPGTAGIRYPEQLKRDGVEGEVLAQFVVDTSGLVRPGSFKSIRASDPQFVAAVAAALPAMRFTPAYLQGRKVPQLVHQPFSFALRGPILVVPAIAPASRPGYPAPPMQRP